jgi:hypothetical protein
LWMRRGRRACRWRRMEMVMVMSVESEETKLDLEE